MSARNRHFVRERALVRAMSTVRNGMYYDERGFRGDACRCSHVDVREASLWEWCVSMLPEGGVWVLAVAVRDAEEIRLLPFEMGCGYGKLESGEGEKREPHLAVVASMEERSLCNVDQIDCLVVVAVRPPSPLKSVHVIICSNPRSPHSIPCNQIPRTTSLPSSSTTNSSSHHVPPRPLRIPGSPLTPLGCSHPVSHHGCVPSCLGIQPSGRCMSVSLMCACVLIREHQTNAHNKAFRDIKL